MGANSSDTTTFVCQQTFDEQLALTLESILDGFFVCDADWRIAYLNTPAEQILRVCRNEVIGKSIWEVLPLALQSQVEQDYRRTSAGEAREFETFVEPAGRWFQHRCFYRKGGGICVYLLDVTDRTIEFQRLRRDEEQYRSLVEKSADCIWESDSQGCFTYLSPSFENITGYPPETFLGRSPLELFPQNPAYKTEQLRASLVSGHMLQALEYRIRHRDGRSITVEINVSPIISADGSYLGQRGVTRDISERTLIAERLRQSLSDLAEAQHVAKFGNWSFDVLANELTWSEELCRMFDNEVTDVEGTYHAFLKCIHPDDRHHVHDASNRALKNGKDIEIEFRIVTRSGSVKHIRGVGHAAKSDENKVVKYFGIAQDITERKEAEIALAEKEERYRLLVDNLRKAVVYQITGTPGGERRFTYISRAVESLNETTVEAVLADSGVIYRQILPEYREMLREREEQALNNISAFQAEVQSRLPSGRLRWFEYTTTPRTRSDGQVVWDGIQIDITDLKQAESALKESLAEKEVLLQEVHHRVKNNLASIISLLDLQKDWIKDKAALDTLTDISNRIMSIALVHERLYRTDNVGLIDIQEYLSYLTDHLLSSCSGNSLLCCAVDCAGIEIALNTAIPLGLIVNELVTNAMKHAFTQGKPRAESTACEIRINARKDGNVISLSVADNGIGMPPNMEWKTCPSLGLRLVSMLGEDQLGGNIHVCCSEGTQITLTFPDQNMKRRTP